MGNKKIGILTILFFGLLISCKKSVDPLPVLEGTTGYAVEYTENTILLEDPGSLVSSDTSKNTYTFNSSAFTSKPKPGEIILVSGELMK